MSNNFLPMQHNIYWVTGINFLKVSHPKEATIHFISCALSSKSFHSTSNEDAPGFLEGCGKINGFKEAGITSEAQSAAIADSGNFFKDFKRALKAADPDMVPEGFSSENSIDVDHDVIASASCITKYDIL